MVFAIIVFQGLIFLVLILVMRHFMKGHVTGAVGHLQKLNDEMMKQQAEFKEKIAAAEKEYEMKTAKAQQEINVKQTQARQEATKLIEEAREKAVQEREKLINEAVNTRDKMRQEVMAEMEDKAIQHSKDLISEFFTGELKRLVHQALVREVVQGLRDVNWEQFQIQTDTAELLMAEPVDAEVKKQIQKVLQEKIGKEVKFKEEIDAQLVGGMTLRFGTFIIDGSLTNRLREASARLKKATARRYQTII